MVVPFLVKRSRRRARSRVWVRVGCATAVLAMVVGIGWGQGSSISVGVLEVDPAQPLEGDDVTFTVAVIDPDGVAVQHVWDFGDGTNATGPSGFTRYVHRYADDGTYTVIHTVEAAGQATASRSFTVTIENAPPEVRRLEVPPLVLPGVLAEFAAPVFDPGEDEITHTWDFGDGSAPVEHRGDPTARHSFEEAGTYVVTVVVDDGDGGTDARSTEVTVGEGFRLEVTGDLTATNRPDRPPILAGYPVERGSNGLLRFRGDLAGVISGEVDVADGAGPCLVILGSQSLTDFTSGTTLYLTAALDGGLVPGSYDVATEHNTAQIVARDPYESEFSQPNTFFARLTHAPDLFSESQPTFHGKDGVVVVHEFDGRRLRVSFDMNLEQSLSNFQLRDPNPPSPMNVRARGAMLHDVEASRGRGLAPLIPMAGGFGDRYLCGSTGELQVVSHDMGSGPETADGAAPSALSAPDAGETPPAAAGAPLPSPTNVQPASARFPWRWEPYADGEAKLEFTFDRPMDASTLNDRSVWLAIPAGIGPGGPGLEPISGIVEAVSDTTFRFLPDWDMRAGVIYEVTIRGGADGVRGANGETLEEDYTWTFMTQVELESVVATVTQVSRGAMLVPDKPMVVRVYAFWRGHDDLPLDVQAIDVNASVTINVNGFAVAGPKEATIRRPDFYNDADRAQTLHTVNFFDWTPTTFGGTSTVSATVELHSDPTLPRATFESHPVTVRHWDRSPTLTVEYYFLEVGSWATGVPDSVLRAHPRNVERAGDFTTQSFPVRGVAAIDRGPLAIEVPEMESVFDSNLNRDTCVVPSMSTVTFPGSIVPTVYWGGLPFDWLLGWELRRGTLESASDVVVGIVPEDVATACGWLGIMTRLSGVGTFTDPTTPRHILISHRAPVPTLAHELGHFFGLCHPTDSGAGCVAHFGTSIEGFRIALDGTSGHNKSQTEGNGEAPQDALVALMHRSIATNDTGVARFISDQHYRHLFTTMAQRDVTLAPEAPVLTATPGTEVLARATAVDGARVSVWALVAPDGRTVLVDRLRPTPRDVVDDALGRYTVALVDEAGVELASVRVRAYEGVSVEQSGSPGRATEPEQLDEPVRAIDAVLPYDDRTYAVVVARDGQELGRITRSANPPTLDAHLEGTTLHWDADDVDGDVVVVDVDYSPDGTAWVPVAVGQPSSGARPLYWALEPGSEPVLRVRASDGFDTVERWVPLDDSPPLRVVVRSHAEGETLDAAESLWVSFNAPFAESHDPSALATLTGADGQPIEVDARLLPGDRRLLLTPREALTPGGYRVDVAGAFRAFGTEAPEESAWQVVVAAAADDASTAPSIPDACAGIERALIESLLPTVHVLLDVEDGERCTVRVRYPGGVAEARRGLETSLLRQRFLPTRNQDVGGVVEVDFEGNGVRGDVRLDAEGSGTEFTLTIGAP